MAITDSERQGYVLLEEVEMALARLYGCYAGLFPEEKDFWNDLVAEEVKHAGWVSALLDTAETGRVEFKEERLVIETFTTFLEYVKHRIDEARHAPLTAFQALSIARDAESTVLERSFFDLFTGADDEARGVLAALGADTERHRQQLEEEWQRYRPAKTK